MLRRSTSTVRRYADEGRLRFRQLKEHGWLEIDRSSVLELLEQAKMR